MAGGNCTRNSVEDHTTLLPPRKRLLCGFKEQNSGRAHSPPPRVDVSSDLSTRIDDLLGLNDVSLEKVIETSKLTASAAANAAAAARTFALEKAAAAVRAKAFAKSVLELVGSCCRREECGDARKRGRKKCVAVEQLYKLDSGPSGGSEGKGKKAWRLHHAVNSSHGPSRRRKLRNYGSAETGGDPAGVSLTASCNKDTFPSSRDTASKTELKDQLRPRPENIEKKGETSSPTPRKNGPGVRTRIMLDDRTGKTKRRRTHLSQCCARDESEIGAAQGSNSNGFSSEQKRIMFRARKIHCNEGPLPLEVDSTRRCKRLKVSQLYSEK